MKEGREVLDTLSTDDVEHANGSETEIARRVAEHTGRDEDAALADVRRLRAEAAPAEPQPPTREIPEAPPEPTPHEPILEPPPREEPLLAPTFR